MISKLREQKGNSQGCVFIVVIATIAILAVVIFFLLPKKKEDVAKKHTHESESHIYAIGDSIILSAKPELQKYFQVDMDAVVGRDSGPTIKALLSLERDRKLTDTIVVHTGNNGSVTVGMLENMLDKLTGHGRIVLVNNNEPREWVKENNVAFEKVAKEYQNVVLVDWYAESKNHPEYFIHDRVHLTAKGRARYAELIAAAVNAE